jgi:hypothetical protein
LRYSYDIASGLDKVRDGAVESRLAGGDGHGLYPTFERCHAAFQNGVRGVADAAVAVTFSFQIE